MPKREIGVSPGQLKREPGPGFGFREEARRGPGRRRKSSDQEPKFRQEKKCRDGGGTGKKVGEGAELGGAM